MTRDDTKPLCKLLVDAIEQIDALINTNPIVCEQLRYMKANLESVHEDAKSLLHAERVAGESGRFYHGSNRRKSA